MGCPVRVNEPTKVGKPVEEVLRYGEAFWRQGPKTFSEEAWKRIKARVEIKEKRLNEVSGADGMDVAERQLVSSRRVLLSLSLVSRLWTGLLSR